MPPGRASTSLPPNHAAEFVARIALAGQGAGLPLEMLFDDLPNLVFFIKDMEGRYACVNRTLAERCGLAEKKELLGKTVADVFPAVLAASYQRQDSRVIRLGRPLLHQLELHWYRARQNGWCLTNKYPLRSERGDAVIGLFGISRDLEITPGSGASRQYADLARVISYVQENLDAPLRVEDLAAIGAMSVHQIESRVRHVFQISPRQLVMKFRLDEAMRLLSATEASLSEIALATGFCDQSAFTRHFRRLAGMPPGLYRTLSAKGDHA